LLPNDHLPDENKITKMEKINPSEKTLDIVAAIERLTLYYYQNIHKEYV
jgi:hypothetical protein